MRAAEVLDEPATPAGDVDVEALWDARRARFRAGLAVLPARIRLPAARRGDLPGTVTVDAEHPDGDDPGALVLDVRFGDPAHAGKVLWELAPHVELLAPPELRAALADRAAATAARYAAPAPGDRDR